LSLLNEVWPVFAPATDMGLAEYSIRKIVNDEGRPFDHLAFPHMVAPGGPMDAFDAPWVREIVEQMASRLGKTFLILCGSLYYAELAPCNQILAGNIQDLGMQQAERVRNMGAYNPAFNGSGLQRSQKRRLEFNGNTIHAAWSRSPVTLSNINALFGGASELDLWEHLTTSKHPDPEEMFGDRFKDNDPIRKEIYESIPTLKGTYVAADGRERPRSRIEARRLAGSDCRFWVSCRFCGCPQVLQIDRVSLKGYRCEGCDKHISDEHRKQFIRSGVWAPRGCTVKPEAAALAAATRLELLDRVTELSPDDPQTEELRADLRWKGWSECDYIEGEPDQIGDVESYQLSSLYALSLSWRRIMQEDHESQNFINQWLGETAEVDEADEIDLDAEARSLANVITGELPEGELPEWAELKVMTIDRQKRVLPWMISGWSRDDALKVHVPRCGNVLSFDELEAIVEKEKPSVILMDCGYLQQDTYDWCLKMTKAGWKCFPCKGSKASVVQQHYKLSVIEDAKGRKSTYRRLKRIDINTQSTQEWVTELLEDRTAIRLWNSDQFAICRQLLNEVETVKRTSRTWDRIDSTPNDQRDNLRYAFVGAMIAATRSRSSKRDSRAEQESAEKPKEFRAVGPSKRPVLTLKKGM